MSIVLPFFARKNAVRDWTNDELAELYLVENALRRANMDVQTDRGVADEGDPWFVFCRHDGEVVIHLARFDGLYHLFSPVLPKPLVGPTFSALTRAFLSTAALAQPAAAANSKVLLHPAALLSLLVVTIFFAADQLTGHGGMAEAAPSVVHATAPAGEHHILRPVIGSFLASMGVVATETLLEQASLIGQAAMAIGDGWLVRDGFLTRVGDSAMSSSAAGLVVAETAGGDMPRGVICDSVSQLGELNAAAVAGDGNGLVGGSLIVAAQGVPAAYFSEATMFANVGGAPNGAETSASGQGDASAFSVDGALTAAQHLPAVVLSALAGGNVSAVIDGGAQLIKLAGDGAYALVSLNGSAAQTVAVLGQSKVSLHLGFASNSSMSALTIKIADGGVVTLDSISVQDAQSSHTVDLTINSGGSQSNALTVNDSAIRQASLNLKIIGTEDLTLRESANVLTHSSLDASGLQGQLTVGIDLTSFSDPVTLAGSSDFVVNDNGIVSLTNVPDQATVQIGTNLQSFSTLFAQSATPIGVNLDLQTTSSANSAVAINIVKVDGATELNLESEASASAANRVQTLIDPDLQRLDIHGQGSLVIGSIVGVTGINSQNITIDASGLNGGLAIDVSQIVDREIGGRQITVIGGHGDNVLVNSNAAEATTFVGGGGVDVFKIGAGAQSVTIEGLKAGDSIVVGAGATPDVVVDATHLSGVQMAVFDALSLQAAAEAASALVGSSASHQAFAFVHDGGLYVFVDANGDHSFDAGEDALVHIVGVAKPPDLPHVFFAA